MNLSTLARNPLRSPSFRALASMAWLLATASMTQAQALDPNLWVTDGRVTTTAISGDRLYIAGTFNYVGPRTGGFAEINAPALSRLGRPPEVNGSVRAMVSDGEGGWYIGGLFSRVAGVARSNGAHVRADGTLDAWNPGTDGPIECLMATPAGIYVGGQFTNCGGEASPNLALVNRTTGASLHWTPTPDGVVRALATDGTNIFVGGRFANINGVARKGFAVVTPAQSVTALNLAINGSSVAFVPDIYTLVYNAGKLYLGGVIISVNGVARNGAAAITTSNGALTSWSPVITSRVRVLMLSRGQVFVGGDFEVVGGQTRVLAAAVDTLTGTTLAWNPALSLFGNVHALLDDGQRIWVGGKFTTATGAPALNLIATDALGRVVPGLSTHTDGTVRALGQDGPHIFVGGTLSSVSGELRGSVAALSLSTGAVLPWNPAVTNGVVQALAVAPGRVYLGGTFRNVGLTARNYAAAVDSATGVPLSWNASPDSAVRTILVSGNSVYLGGHFRNCGGLARKLVALVNNTTGAANAGFDCPLGRTGETATTLMYVQSMALSGTKLYLGGLFDRIRYTSPVSTPIRNRACAVNAATGAVFPWNPDLDGVVRAILPTASGIFAAGDFIRVSNQGLFTTTMLFDTLGVQQQSFQGFTSDTTVNAILVNGTTLTAGGGCYNIGLSNRNGLGSTNWQTGISTPWDPAPDLRDVTSLVVDPATNDLIVGGGFEMMGVHRAHGLARFKGTLPSNPAVTVTSPTPGTSIDIGNTFRIEWTSSANGPGIQSADVYVSQGGVNGQYRLLAAGIQGKNSYDWVLDNTVAPSTLNFVRVEVRDWYGNVVSDVTNAAFNTFISVVTGVDPGAQAAFALRPVSPNPVRGGTQVSFVAPRAAHVTLSVHDVQGRTLAVLANGEFAAGTHQVAVDTAALPAGLCFLRLQTPSGTLSQRFVTLH